MFASADPPDGISTGCASAFTTDSDVILCATGDGDAVTADSVPEFCAGLEQAVINSSPKPAIDKVVRVIFLIIRALKLKRLRAPDRMVFSWLDVRNIAPGTIREE
jgi:hypothetical protein